MTNYGLKISKQGYDVFDAEPKDLVFSSAYPCLKIIQLGNVSAVSSSEITFDNIVSFPLVILVFLYNSSTSRYEPVEASFDSTKLYLTGGEESGSYYYYFICYA